MKIDDLKFKTGRVDHEAVQRLYGSIHQLPISQHDAEILMTALQVYLEAKVLDGIAQTSYDDHKAAYDQYLALRPIMFMRTDLTWLTEAVHFQLAIHGYQCSTPLGIIKIRLREWWEDSLVPKLTKIMAKQREANRAVAP